MHVKSRFIGAALLAAGSLLASGAPGAQTIEWRNDNGSTTIDISNAPGWYKLYDPYSTEVVAMTSVGTPTPGGGQRIQAIITSDFLFDVSAVPQGFHFVVALNYAPVFSNGWNWTYGVMGNQASAATFGDANQVGPNDPAYCPFGARLEAIYQVTAYIDPWWAPGWGQYPFGVTTGVNGDANELSGCIGMPAGAAPSGASELYVSFDSRYDGQASLYTAPFNGSSIASATGQNWYNWVNSATTTGMFMNSGIGLAAVGQVPPGKFVRIQFIEASGY
jgi:hypothetical protein